jgi:type III pantothenate kinase
VADQKFLLIDISNSFTKFALANREKLIRTGKLATADLSAARVRSRLPVKDADIAVISSVVPAREKIVLRALKRCEIVRVSAKLQLGVGIEYPKPATIGADRLANATAVVARYGAPAVVVDFGTAVTFDIISPSKKYIGGVIAPGLAMMSDYLYQRTALLPKITLREPVSVIGRTTKEAMLAGAVIGYRGLVREILSAIRREIPGQLQVIATGGYATLIAQKLPDIQHVDRHLTLEGLRIIATLNT